MSGIINDISNIVDEVNIKPNKTKLVIKWVISVAISLITLAFAFGQFKSSFFNKMDEFEKTIKKNTSAIEKNTTIISNMDKSVNKEFEEAYNDIFNILEDYQNFNKKQLMLVLDYGQSNKSMLKEILEYNVEEKNKSLRNEVLVKKKIRDFDTDSTSKSQHTPKISVKKIID